MISSSPHDSLLAGSSAYPPLREARKIAARERPTLRALVEQGLHRVIAEKARKPGFRLRDASFDGRGLNPEFADAGWDRLRDLIYGKSPN